MELIETRTYTAYGQWRALSSNATRLGFNGEPIDKSLTLYLLGNGTRGYYPALMRFISPDTESPFFRGGLNCYCFTLNDPINGSDPTGHFTIFSKSITYKYPLLPVKNLPGKAFYAPSPVNPEMKALTIMAHSGEQGFGNRTTVDYRELMTLLTNAKVLKKGMPLHIIGCRSAHLAESITKDYNIETIAYKDIVNAPFIRAPALHSNFKLIEKESTFNKLTGSKSAYSSRVVFEPIRSARRHTTNSQAIRNPNQRTDLLY
ncbi:RHS repeat-associated core domain-containing protein [Pseudomonas sp. WSY_20]|uniref:RHS repeat-associated core domain-containing protein n=1 Tax=Pseudomonas sp. WSY_20 TaxID=3367212 RepID=UPI00370AF004